MLGRGDQIITIPTEDNQVPTVFAGKQLTLPSTPTLSPIEEYLLKALELLGWKILLTRPEEGEKPNGD